MSLPSVPDTFEWIQTSWGAALRCVPLQAVAPHLFTTRQLELSSPSDWRRVASAVGAADVQTLTQVHGAAVVAIKKERGVRGEGRDGREGREGRTSGPDADILVSDDPAIALAVRAADCVPLLLADPSSGAVAAVHAGWRGTAAGAAPAAVAALEREFGSRASDLVAAIGPSIGPCCYEVGTELVDAFAAAGYARYLVDRWFVAPPPRRGEYERPRLRLDTWGANRDQLVLAGVAEQNIHVCGLCTASHLALFPSYRVEKEKAGRMAGVIRSTAKRPPRPSLRWPGDPHPY
jgi:polyphenol oxidase